MSRCWLEGEWRAYLDRELAPDEMDAATQHLGTCRECSALVRELGARAERVSALLEALEYMPEARPVLVPAPARWRRPALAIAVGLAAALLVMLALPKRQPAAGVRKPVVGEAGSLQRTVSPPVAGRRLTTRAQLTKQPHKIQRHVEYYLALDDEPIESGVVVQVTLPDTGLLAEVIYDDYGRPRAVRPLN